MAAKETTIKPGLEQARPLPRLTSLRCAFAFGSFALC
jgi:hypothetical protein